ncbi:hypothetical protein EUTSA_v10003302mg [Eutrema salsugineum]|uniref:Uncharacterized protein n=1 Tax=Eutrema salsugineum TaxID=72664 RepID=V4L2Z1_EUTSA|nr:hypothetical protein EUTSA_v10003302mg [Eutrema salsugineum]
MWQLLDLMDFMFIGFWFRKLCIVDVRRHLLSSHRQSSFFPKQPRVLHVFKSTNSYPIMFMGLNLSCNVSGLGTICNLPYWVLI